jgi:dienelactone hydrolase
MVKKPRILIAHTIRCLLICLGLGVVVLPASPCRALEIAIAPQRSMIDRPVETTVRAPAQSVVNLTFTTERFGFTFSSEAIFRVPASGILRVSDSAPLSGSYQGKHAMGLFWSAVPTGPASKPAQDRRDSDLAPRPYTISASAGTATATATGVRVVLADDVTRQVVDSKDFVGTLFLPTQRRCSPGVIVLGGSEGGVPEEQAAVIASHHLATLALAYFGAPGLPTSLVNVPIEVVQRALAFLQQQPAVCPREAAILGGSKGAELALLAASVFGGVRAVVAVKPASVVFYGLSGDTQKLQSSWSYRGEPVAFANGPVPSAITNENSQKESSHQRPAYVDDYLARVRNNTDPAAIIPVQTIDAPILLVAGGADRLWPSDYMAEQIMLRRRAMSRPFGDEFLFYPRAGHLIGIPYGFAKAELAHSSLDVGGSPEADEGADEESWPAIIRFLQGVAR